MTVSTSPTAIIAPAPFKVVAKRRDKQWVLTAHTGEGIVTALAPSLADAQSIAEDAIAFSLEISANSVRADIVHELGDPLTAQLINWRDNQARADAARAEAHAMHAELVAALLESMSTADASAILGLSRQRINELAREHRESPQP